MFGGSNAQIVVGAELWLERCLVGPTPKLWLEMMFSESNTRNCMWHPCPLRDLCLVWDPCLIFDLFVSTDQCPEYVQDPCPNEWARRIPAWTSAWRIPTKALKFLFRIPMLGWMSLEDSHLGECPKDSHLNPEIFILRSKARINEPGGFLPKLWNFCSTAQRLDEWARRISVWVSPQRIPA